MTKHHEDIMTSIISAAMLKTSDCFNPDFEVFRRDLGRIFAGVIQQRLEKLAAAHDGDETFPINQMADILSGCTWEFESKIDSIVYKALDAAKNSLCRDMVTLFDKMTAVIADEVRASA